MDINRARHLIQHWPEDARYQMNERWSIMSPTESSEAHFWKAIADTRKVYAYTWDLTLEKATQVLSIKNEEKERATWNKLQAALALSAQQRLY
jgi:hypothetical protein